MWTYNYSYSSELYHHGILGMKWGVRRYQKKDGTLTNAGKKRKAKLESVRDSEIELTRRQKAAWEEEVASMKNRRDELAKPSGKKLIKDMLGVDTDADAMDLYAMTIKELQDDEVAYTNHRIGVGESAIQGFLAKEAALANMDLSDLSIKKKDIIAVGEEAQAKGWAEYDNEHDY